MRCAGSAVLAAGPDHAVRRRAHRPRHRRHARSLYASGTPRHVSPVPRFADRRRVSGCRDFDRWPQALQRQFGHIAFLAPAFDIYLLDVSPVLADADFYPRWRALFRAAHRRQDRDRRQRRASRRAARFPRRTARYCPAALLHRIGDPPSRRLAQWPPNDWTTPSISRARTRSDRDLPPLPGQLSRLTRRRRRS